MRILNLIPSLSGGGAERQAFYLAAQLVRMGHEVHIAYIYGRGRESTFADAGVILHALECRGNYDPRLMARAVRLVRSVRPDVIQTWILQMDVIGGMAAWLTGTPWVLREPSTGSRYRGTIKNTLRVWLASKASAIVSNSVGGDDYWQSRVPNSVCHIIPNGVALTEIDSVQPRRLGELGLADVGRFLMYAGRFEPGKNLRNLVSAFAMVMADHPVAAVMCGDGPMRPEIEKHIGELGLAGRAAMPGYTPRIWEMMKSAELFTFVSFFEGCPNVVMEAMACGCPTVLSDISAHRSIADETTTVFVDPSDPQSIAQGIRTALAHPDETMARAREARARADGWTIAEMARRYEQVYEAVARK